MNGAAWRLVDAAGLGIRRQMELGRGWRPWVAAFGVAPPALAVTMLTILMASAKGARLNWYLSCLQVMTSPRSAIR